MLIYWPISKHSNHYAKSISWFNTLEDPVYFSCCKTYLTLLDLLNVEIAFTNEKNFFIAGEG